MYCWHGHDHIKDSIVSAPRAWQRLSLVQLWGMAKFYWVQKIRTEQCVQNCSFFLSDPLQRLSMRIANLIPCAIPNKHRGSKGLNRCHSIRVHTPIWPQLLYMCVCLCLSFLHSLDIPEGVSVKTSRVVVENHLQCQCQNLQENEMQVPPFYSVFPCGRPGLFILHCSPTWWVVPVYEV